VSFTVGLDPAFSWPTSVQGGTIVQIRVTLMPLDIDGNPIPQLVTLGPIVFDSGDTTAKTQKLFGCTNNVRVVRSYGFYPPAGGGAVIGCTATDDIATNTITIPAPSPLVLSPPDTGTCTAPAL
jgi:hypothetical protein